MEDEVEEVVVAIKDEGPKQRASTSPKSLAVL